jgi:PAS domain S-box-containing protein
VSVAVVSLVGILFVVSRTVIMENVAEVEQKTTSQSINRVLNALANELNTLDATTQDYAGWDDTYAFIQNGNTNYVNLNLMDTTFANLRLNLMLFVNTSGQIVFGKAYDPNNATEVPVPQGFLAHLAANRLILSHDSIESSVVGTILLPEGPLLVASRPILDSNRQGPILGTLVTGRFLDSTELSFLSDTTKFPLALQSIAGSSISSDFQTANLSLSTESTVFVQPLSNERVAGYVLLDDVYGNSILILRADMPRDIYAQGLAGTFYTAVSLVATGVAFGFLTLFLLEKFVISRLTRLSAEVSEIERSGNLSVRVSEAGKDELTGLGKGINRMLSALGQTQGKLMEERARTRESEEKLRNTIESSPEAITLINMNGKVVDCNQAALEMFGYAKKEEMVGKDGFAVISSKDRTKVMEDLAALPQKGPIKNIGVRMVAKDGREFAAEASASLVRDASGNPKYVVTLVRDITERKQMEQKLEEYSQQLEEMVEHRTKQLKETQKRLVKSERLAAIGQVAAMVGHDLRNPLTGISGAAYYLKMKLGPNAEKRTIQMLEIIEKDIQYSNKIITDLMDYSREIKLELTETTPKSIIAESISLIRIPEKVQLADLTQNEPRIKIDIDKMKRVFANFIKNAVDAMPQGGKLTISSRASSNNVEFMLIDSGVGMAKEVMEQIWTPFFTTKAKGMGLGLAICRRIIEVHQGKISVESIVGEGTTFTITIPLEPKPRVEGGEKVWVNLPESLLSTTTKA